jgi:LDH2 family malate/lactate/ureidoglycolate dehydrogenase
MLGTNPIAFGAPTDEDCPFLFDAATSIIQRGKIEILSRAEKLGMPGWVIDQQSRPLTDPDEVLRGLTRETASLLPLGGAGENLGGHKGYGLATIVEILSASLQMGAFLHGLSGVAADGSPQPLCLGHFFMAIDIESFVPLADFKKTTGDIVRELRQSRPAPECERIFTAGEKEFENEKRIRQHGIPVLPNLQKEIKFIQQELGLTQYPFHF